MKNAHAQGGWAISEVEHLTGLSRRDIQRCCYQGKGGMGILEPQDSSWGRRSYSAADIATLYLVRLEKRSGMSLPEISKKFQAKRSSSAFNTLDALEAHKARVEEQIESLSGHKLSATALLEACGNEGSSQKLGELIEHELTTRIKETAFEHRYATVEKRRASSSLAEKDACSVHRQCELPTGWLTTPMSKAQREGSAHKADILQDAARGAFVSAIDCLHASNSFPTCSDARRAILFALDAPGMDLALELWLGPGASKHIRKAIW